jgi:two-component system, NarL family, invasion response regulator UvrY
MDLPVRLVIVDDHPLMRETWKMVLQRDPRLRIIAECASGEEAIACAEKQKPDIMLMDINMAPINGFDATRKIAGSHSGIRIIGISINNQPTYARNLLQLGAKGYVTKNSSPEEMIKAIVTVANGGIYICKEVRDQMPEHEG